MKMIQVKCFVVALICIQGVSCGRLYPRMLLDSVQHPESSTGGGSYFHHSGPMSNPMNGPMSGQMGGAMSGQMGGGMSGQMGGPMSGHMGGPMSGHMGSPSGDPMRQQEHNQHSLTPNGSCVPSQSDCACPDYRFHAPSGCYFCICAGYQGQAQLSSTPIVSAASTKQASVNSTPLIHKTTPPVTVAMTTTSPPTTTESQCATAAQFCLMNCPDGYLVDPDDCTFCVCKKNVIAGR